MRMGEATGCAYRSQFGQMWIPRWLSSVFLRPIAPFPLSKLRVAVRVVSPRSQIALLTATNPQLVTGTADALPSLVFKNNTAGYLDGATPAIVLASLPHSIRVLADQRLRKAVCSGLRPCGQHV